MKRSGPPKRRTELSRGSGLSRKAPLRSGKPLQATQGLQAGSGLQSGAPMRQVSPKKAKKKRERASLVERMVAEGVRCEIGPELARYGITGCTTRIGGIHERRKLSSAGTMIVAGNLVPACNRCNGFVEDHLPMLRDRYPELHDWLVIREGHPEWDEMGARQAGARIQIRLCQTCGAAHVTVPPSGVLPCGHRHV